MILATCRDLRRVLLAVLSGLFIQAALAAPPCLDGCRPRIGIVSAYGEEAKLLIAETRGRREHHLNGNRFTTGTLRGQRVVIVLSGVSMVNAAMVTQLLLDRFRVERLVMSGIAGGLNPAQHTGDVSVPDRWAMPMEVYWHHDNSLPTPCGAQPDISCLGLRLARQDGRVFAPHAVPVGLGDAASAPAAAASTAPTGLFVREHFVLSQASAPQGEFRFDYPVDAAMLAVARRLTPRLARCGAAASAVTPDPRQCVRHLPALRVGGRGLSGTAFLANPAYARYLRDVLQGETVEMETAALAHVAHANGVPYIAFRSISDLPAGQAFDADAVALFASGLAETNAAAVTLGFLEAWTQAHPRAGTRVTPGRRPAATVPASR